MSQFQKIILHLNQQFSSRMTLRIESLFQQHFYSKAHQEIHF